jgi:hypothetical protein
MVEVSASADIPPLIRRRVVAAPAVSRWRVSAARSEMRLSDNDLKGRGRSVSSRIAQGPCHGRRSHPRRGGTGTLNASYPVWQQPKGAAEFDVVAM